jgi:predicted membrane-bound spermidine synthase
MARRTPPLELIVFVVGTATLGSEIAAARLMAPFFGASTIVWANTIATVLVALSIGYWFGGRMADRHPSVRPLSGLILVAAFLLALVPLVADPFLTLSVEAFDTVDVGAAAGSLFGVLALVALPVLLLGAVSPWAIRLKLTAIEDSGQTAGRMYAISTVGSLLGTFAATLLLIPLLGTQRTFLTFALLLTLVAAWGLGARYLLAPAAIVVLLALPAGTVKDKEGAGRVVEERDTEMQYARVVEYPDGERHMELNEGQAVHSLYRPETVLTENVWDGYLIVPFAGLERPPERIAILGFAGGTTARAYEKYFPRTRIDGVEIDGELFDLAKRWFGLNERPELELHAEDARPFLRRSEHRYDAIFVDA